MTAATAKQDLPGLRRDDRDTHNTFVIGRKFVSRLQLKNAGLHTPLIKNYGLRGRNIYSLILDGKMDIIWDEGTDLLINGIKNDEKSTTAFRACCQNNIRIGHPVHIIRAPVKCSQSVNKYPSSGFRYDGLYTIHHVKYRELGVVVYFRRVDGQSDIPGLSSSTRLRSIYDHLKTIGRSNQKIIIKKEKFKCKREEVELPSYEPINEEEVFQTPLDSGICACSLFSIFFNGGLLGPSQCSCDNLNLETKIYLEKLMYDFTKNGHAPMAAAISAVLMENKIVIMSFLVDLIYKNLYDPMQFANVPKDHLVKVYDSSSGETNFTSNPEVPISLLEFDVQKFPSPSISSETVDESTSLLIDAQHFGAGSPEFEPLPDSFPQRSWSPSSTEEKFRGFEDEY